MYVWVSSLSCTGKAPEIRQHINGGSGGAQGEGDKDEGGEMTASNLIENAEALFSELNSYEDVEKIETINKIRKILHQHSPFKDEPVDYVQWIKNDKVQANDYNPNIVAPPEMELLKLSISNDGYTQPIVSWNVNDHYEVVDGFHRHRVGSESKSVQKRVFGYLPLVIVNEDCKERGDRIASTIRHNRAKGKHTIEGMSDIVIELKRRNRSNQWISKQLGMDEDEILRLTQITGLAELFSDEEFSKSWDVEDGEDDFAEFSDDVDTYGNDVDDFRTVNTNDEDRIFHTFDKWECFKAGFYATTKDGMTKEGCEEKMVQLLTDEQRFAEILEHIITEWKYSCEHYLTNKAMNRIAWLGQASLCYAEGIPATYRGGYNLLTRKQQKRANEIALEYLNKWLENNGEKKIAMEEAMPDRQMELY